MFSGGFLACCVATIVLLQNSKRPCGCWTATIVLLYNSNSLVWLPHSLCVVSTQRQVCGRVGAVESLEALLTQRSVA